MSQGLPFHAEFFYAAVGGSQLSYQLWAAITKDEDTLGSPVSFVVPPAPDYLFHFTVLPCFLPWCP